MSPWYVHVGTIGLPSPWLFKKSSSTMPLLTWGGWELKELRSNTSECNMLGKNFRDWWLLSRTSDWSLSQPDLEMPGLNLPQAIHFYSINHFFPYIVHISENTWHSNPIFSCFFYSIYHINLKALSFRRLQQHGYASSAPVSHFSSLLKGKTSKCSCGELILLKQIQYKGYSVSLAEFILVCFQGTHSLEPPPSDLLHKLCMIRRKQRWGWPRLFISGSVWINIK